MGLLLQIDLQNSLESQLIHVHTVTSKEHLLVKDKNFKFYLELYYLIKEFEFEGNAEYNIDLQLLDNKFSILFQLYVLQLGNKQGIPTDFAQDFLAYIHEEVRSFDYILKLDMPDERLDVNISLFKLRDKFLHDSKLHLEINSLYDLLRTVHLIIKISDTRLNTCKVCSSFFIPEAKQHGELCNYLHLNGKSCTYVLSQQNAKERIEADELLKQCNRLYKRVYMRFERAIDRSLDANLGLSPASLESFNIWSQELSSLRQDYLDKKISADDFSLALTHYDIAVNPTDLYQYDSRVSLLET